VRNSIHGQKNNAALQLRQICGSGGNEHRACAINEQVEFLSSAARLFMLAAVFLVFLLL